ncbi:radical SAM protein, partial [bacterium]|nr:radical SAM protein [bacterium]
MTRSRATAGSFVPQYLASWLRGPADPRPVYVTLFVTAKCDARCPHCFYIPRIENSKAIEDLSCDEIERIARTMPPFYKLLLSGGEPFLRPDLPRVCRAFADHCDTRQITIPTNALHPVRIERQVREMADDGRVLWEIALSIDGVGEMHDEIRCVPGAFARLTETFERLRNLATHVDNLVVRFNITVSRRNQDRLLDILDHVENVWRHDLVDMTLIRGEAHDPNWKNVDAEK